MIRLVAALLLTSAALFAADFQARLDTGGIYRMFTAGQPVVLKLSASTAQPGQVSVKLRIADIFGKTQSSEEYALGTSGNGRPAELELVEKRDVGYYSVHADFSDGQKTLRRWTDFGIVPPPASGLRPDSFFSSNTSGLRTGNELKLLQMIGMKVQRAHFQPNLAAKVPATPAGALPLNFTNQDKAWAASQEAGLWVLPIAGYAFEGTKSELATLCQMHGPPRDYAEFCATWEQILKHYPEVTTIEFWNEPWIFGWTWAASGEEYRKLQKMWCEMALKVNPNYRILAGNSSMFTEDHIEHDTSCWKGLLQGTTHHPYSFSTGQPNHRAGDTGRSTDHGMQVTNRMGLPYYYLTEGGTEYSVPDSPEVIALRKSQKDLQEQLRAFPKQDQKVVPASVPAGRDAGATLAALKLQTDEIAAELSSIPLAKNNNGNASKIVIYNIRAALLGTFQGNSQWEIGYGPGWTRSNVSFATMTHFLEDRPAVADIWPEHELIWGAIFAGPRHVTPAVKVLPRASELSPRWNVAVPKERAFDSTKVAVVWSYTGASNEALDSQGTLAIEDAADMQAFDMTGRPIERSGKSLKVPFTQNPVYITTDALDVVEFRNRLASAKIEDATPLNMYALSLFQTANQSQALSIRLENQLNVELKGKLCVKLPSGSKSKETKFAIPPGKLVEVAVAWPGCSVSQTNTYPVTLLADTEHGKVTREQTLCVARFVKHSITVDGDLKDWAGVTPVAIDSAGQNVPLDPTQYLLNPGLKRPEAADSRRVAAWVYTAFDDDNVYLAVAVNEDKLECTAGQPTIKGRGETKRELPYKNGDPAGLNHIRYCGDAFLFAFGFRDRVPGWGRQMNDPYAWKGQFYDTDYHYAAHTSAQGDKLIRLWGPGTARRTAYQTEVVPGVEPVPGARIVIKRDEAAKLSIYELALPRSELSLFAPETGRCRFGFILANGEQAGGGALRWSDAAGVFDHWRCAGSFSPSWQQELPCQTFFGIEP
ncbi:MAG TPA: hypothetical protein VGP72_23845 [Planctomycetota bacterium]|jgi:hypothetical protein